MKVILFGLRRSGTTLAFNLFRQCHGLRCYYEPLHPRLVAGSGLSCIEHDRKGAYTEYKLIFDELKIRHVGFGAPKFDVTEEILADNLTPKHLDYLDFLFSSAENVLLQPVRLNYQVYQLQARYPEARFIWVLRHPEGFIKSVLAYRPSMPDYRDAGLPSNRAIESCKKNVIFRLSRGWDSFDNPWSQVAAANFIVNSRPYFRSLSNSPTWVKLLALWYDHYMFVHSFIKSNPHSTQVLIYENACNSATYIKQQMKTAGLVHTDEAFSGLIDSAILQKQNQSSLDISTGEKLIQERILEMGMNLDLSLRNSMDSI